MGVNGDVIAISRHEGDFYQLTFTNVCRAGAANRAGGGATELWHRGLGHLDVRSLYALQSMVRDVHLGESSHPTFILVCTTYP
jgi:hypothetical protein